MIPTEEQAKALWNKYRLPESKRIHVALVARVTSFLAEQLAKSSGLWKINNKLLVAAALLHDIDKTVPKMPGETHPDTAVRILREEGMEEVAVLVATHSLHAILDPTFAPKTWEEKLLYLSDKMVKQEIITVDKRFALWRSEDLPHAARRTLDACYPKVKELEKEVFALIEVKPHEVALLA